MTAPKPAPPKKALVKEEVAPKRRSRRKPVSSEPKKQELVLNEHLMHRPFSEALKDFFKKEEN